MREGMFDIVRACLRLEETSALYDPKAVFT
jgi:hypothetical protein